MRGIIYARYSTDRQSESSIADQIRLCREFAERAGWAIAHEFTDEGISGAALGNRPGAQSALAAARSGDSLLLTDLSRLSRSQDLAPLLARLRHRGVRVIGVQDGFDSESRTARMQAGLSGIMSEEFRAMVADRTRSALEARALTGRSTGGKAYADADVIREVFARFAGGETMKAIVADLNRRGIPSPGADWKVRANPRGRWLVSALRAVLRNERYAGRLIWNRSQWVKDPDTGKRHRRERPAAEWITQPCEVLIDEVTWRRVQSRFYAGSSRGGVARYLLSGLMECALCGSKMIVMGGSQHRYTCGAHHAGGAFACANGVTFTRASAEEKILAPVIEDLLSPAAVEEGVRLLREERARAEKAPNAMHQEIEQLERLVRDGTLSRDIAAPALAEARRRAATPPDLPWPNAGAWRQAVRLMREVLQGDDVIAARAVLRDLLGPIRCQPRGDHTVAELTARQVLLATGTGSWVGSGGALEIYLPRFSRNPIREVL